MRFADDVGGEGWPNEMQLFVSVNESCLVELLYIRSALQLQIGVETPGLSLEPPERLKLSSSKEVSEVSSAWIHEWRVALDWVSQTAERNKHLHSLFDEPAESDPSAISDFLPPQWAGAYIEEKLERKAFIAWQSQLPAPADSDFLGTPEQKSLTELVDAWRRGLTVLIILPFADAYSRQLTDRAILISTGAYTDSRKFSAALAGFRQYPI